MHKSLTIFGVVFVLACFLQAVPQVTGTITSTRNIDGYFNSTSTNIQIEVRLVAGDFTDCTGDCAAEVELWYGISNSTSITINGDASSGVFDESNDAQLRDNPVEFSWEGSDRVATYTLDVTDLRAISSNDPENKYFDFEISLSNDSPTKYPVNFPESPYVKYDTDPPSMTWLTPTGVGTFYFNTTTISFTLDLSLIHI